MAISQSNFALIVLSVICGCQYVYSTEYVPVYMWGDLERSTQQSNPLSKLSGQDFDNTLKDELRNQPFTVVFIEETLSVEDLSSKDTEGSIYPYLHSNTADSLYLPSVASALHTLNKLADPEKVDRVKLTENGLSAEIEPKSGKFLFINLKDAREGESRVQLLKRHDAFMEDMFAKLQAKYDRVVAIYTAHYPSWIIADDEPSNRVRRHLLQAVENTSNVSFYNVSGNLLLYVKKLALQEMNFPEEVLLNPSSVQSRYNNTDLDVTFEFSNHTVLLKFRVQRGYWFLNEADVSSKSSSQSETIKASSVYAITGFSYHCSNKLVYKGPNSTFQLTFNDVQMQPFFNNITGSKFGDSFDCVGFTSVPIWSGLFVVFIFLLITFYGVTMMMDIRTMDRFDDPKGKTITINAAE